MDILEKVRALEIQVEALNQQYLMAAINMDQISAKVDQGQADILQLISKLNTIIPVIGNTTTQLFASDTITSISVTPILFDLKPDDKIVVHDLYLEQTFDFTVTADSAIGDTSIRLTSTVLDYDLTANSLVVFKMVRSAQQLKIDN